MMMASSHNSHGNNNASNTEAASLVRPTEAQLRWAQFHHKRRALRVRASVQALHQSPATWEQVPGSLPEDGNSSSSSCSDDIKEIRNARRLPTISKGRRALLRVSRRNYQRRREVILTEGYLGTTLLSGGSSDTEGSTTGSHHHQEEYNNNTEHHAQEEDEESDGHEDELDEIFMVQSSRRRRRKRKHPKRRHPKDDSFKRFQAACHAMMMNLAAPPKHSVVIPTRKWTRTVDAAAALDDEYFFDPKWGIRRRPDHGGDVSNQTATGTSTPNATARNFAPMDRGASWMMHLPKGISTARHNPYYHDPSLALPPSANNFAGSDSQESSVAPGAHKFKMLVDLVQQRMIQRQNQQDKSNVHDEQSASQLDESGISEFHTRRPMNGIDHDDDDDIYSPHSSKKRPVRRAHYVPRMRLRDFVPEGTGTEEELERSLMEGKVIPPKMKLQRLKVRDDCQLPTSRRKSKTQELAELYEPIPNIPKRDRGMSKTRQMAQTLEGNKIITKHPTMRLRQSYQSTNAVANEEKKLSDDGADHSIGPPRRHPHTLAGPFDQPGEQNSGHSLNRGPVRHPHALSGPFSGPATGSQEEHQMKPTAPILSPLENGISPDTNAGQNGDSSELLLPTPPRRKPHPMSHHFIQVMQQAAQESPQRPQIVIKPLPPDTCCSRCTKQSPVHLKNNQNALYFLGNTNIGSGGDSGSHLSHHPVRNSNAKVSIGSSRVSDFFSQLRHGSDASTLGDATIEKTSKRDSTSCSTEETKSTTGSHRVSDFFAKVRQLNPTSIEQQPSQDTSQTDDMPVEERDFFAQVREMIATNDDDEESAAQRVSDFFAQVRHMTTEMQEENLINPLCEECQVHDIEDRLETASVTLSPEHGATRSDSTIPARVANTNMTGNHHNGASFDDDAKSEHSAISGLWNRGRSSLNSFASSLNAISEKNAGGNVVANPTGLGRISATNMPGRVGGFLQRLQGQKEQEKQQEGQLAKVEKTKPLHSLQLDHGEGVNYDDGNDLEAMAAYRQSLETKRLSSNDGDESSHSSFHVLPDDILEVVKRKGSSPWKNARELSTSPQRPPPDSLQIDDQYPSSTNPIEKTQLREGLDTDLAASALSRPSAGSPGQLVLTSSALDGLSPEKYREIQGKFLQSSQLFGNGEQGVIDTDGTTSDASNSGMDPHILASMMLSPDLLQKRLHQAVRAVEDRRWDHVEYLLNANPWLAEMCELTSNQYLLHKIAFFGVSAPPYLCENLMERFPSAIYKFDQDGNVPLHLAAAAGHMKMIRMLGEKFQSGASIRNEDGMLPLHFAIASYADYDGQDDDDDDEMNPLGVIRTVLKLFPQAVAIGDNDGNLPIHVAAECLNGGFGVNVIYMLLDEADRQLQDPDGARFHNRGKLKDIVLGDIAACTMPSDGEIDFAMDDETHCIMVKNDFGETPMLAAVRHRRGWDVIEALVSGPGGHSAALYEDADKNNLLHLLVGEYQDPAAAVSILKFVPKTTTMRNSHGMLPIEVACLQLMPEEVILAMALVDLPFDIGDKDRIRPREDHGGSWWFLACECDDHYVDTVQQILMICTFHQIRELCFAQRGSSQQKETVISRATPKCKLVLSHALRFLGRFEFLGESPLEVDSTAGLKVFDALDFADVEGIEEGRRVVLKCYSVMDSFVKATTIIRAIPFDPGHVEEIVLAGDNDGQVDGQLQLCIAIECPQVTLNRVVDGMTKKEGYQYDTELRKKYAAKMCAVLRLIAKAIRHLHECGVVHGNICMDNCGKFEHTWKLLDIMGSQRTGAPMPPSRYQRSFPPEVLQLDDYEGAICDSDNTAVSLKAAPASPSMDIWAFGKLAYEALVGKPLVDFESSKVPIEDMVSLLQILEWDQSNMKAVFTDLLKSGVTDSCAELITSCLFPHPEDRPVSMDAIIQDPFWKDMRQYRERTSPSKRRRGHATRGDYSSGSSPTKSIFTETNSYVDTSQEVGSTAEI